MRKSKLIRCILLLAVFLFACCLCSCTQKQKADSGGWGAYPLLSVKWDTTILSIDQADIEVSFGLIPRNMDSRFLYKSEGVDEILCFALYYCKPDDDSLLALYYHETEIEDYKNIAGHYFIKEIGYTEALHGKYKMWYDLRGNSHFQHSETLTIPRSVLEFCGDEVALRLAVIGKMDDKTVLVDLTARIFLSYNLLDNEQVVLNSVRGER